MLSSHALRKQKEFWIHDTTKEYFNFKAIVFYTYVDMDTDKCPKFPKFSATKG